MTSDYLPPNAKLAEEIPIKRKLGNAALAILSSIVALPLILYTLMLVLFGQQEADFLNPKFLLLNTASALMAGVFVYPFRTWPWHIAVLVAPFVGFAGLILLVLLHEYFL